jgi:hypothetical protein
MTCHILDNNFNWSAGTSAVTITTKDMLPLLLKYDDPNAIAPLAYLKRKEDISSHWSKMVDGEIHIAALALKQIAVMIS